jgi:hypothetical protein
MTTEILRKFCFVILTLPSMALAKSLDFSVTYLSNPHVSKPWVGSCRDRIRQSICLVDPAKEDDTPDKRVCLKSDLDYAKPFEELYDRMPLHLQKMFCYLERIFIEKEFIGSAYGSLYVDSNDPNNILGGMIGIREDFILHPSLLDDWASWKEQIHFGANPKYVNVSKNLPVVETSLQSGSSDMLYFLVAHEFGHIFDFTNHLNHDSCPLGSTYVGCAKPSWHSFSWDDKGKPLPQNDFPLRSALCYYFCGNNFIDPSRQDELYQSLSQTTFLTPYATRFPSEDFADTFAMYTIMSERNANYVIKTQNHTYDVVDRLQSPDFDGKRNYIKEFLLNPYAYPGE